MELTFSSIEEVKEFVKQLKGTRGGKDDKAEPEGNSPAPLAPQTGGQTFTASGAGGAFPSGGGFPGSGGAAQPGPAELLVNRIVAKFDASVAAGASKHEDGVAWFRGQCGQEGANATWDQIRTILMPKLPIATLDGIAKQMGA